MSDVDDEVLRRHFVAVATGKYDDPAFPPLEVDGEVAALRDWLCHEQLGPRRFTPRFPELAANPTKTQIRDALEDPPPERLWRAGDAAVVFVTGHGTKADDTHYLVLKGTDSSRLVGTAIRTGDLIAWLAETRIRHLLVVLDACYAGAVARDTTRLDRDLPPTWLVLPSATKNEQAIVGALTSAVTRFLDKLGRPEGGSYGGALEPYLKVDEFLRGVREHLDPGQTVTPLYGSQLGDRHLCLPNPHYRGSDTAELTPARHELALPRSDLETHWRPRARGVMRDDEPGWLFTGRATLIRALIDAATGAAGATVVTGGAGSGKSAALARLVTLSDTRFVDQHRDELHDVPDELRPPAGAVDVAVLATGKLHTQVLAQICTALHVPPPATAHAEPTDTERLDAWHHWLTTHQRPLTIVVDALDEATHPHDLLHNVLAKLEPDPTHPHIRLLIGVRSHAAGSRPEPQPSSGAALADTAAHVLQARRIPVDEPPWWNQHDVTDYVGSILRHTPRSPYHAVSDEIVDAVAGVLGTQAGRSFLIARIAASSLAAHHTVVQAADPAWRAALNDGVLGVFRDDLHRSLPNPNDRHRAVVLLRAVAFAYGAGLPWGNIWPLVAHAVDDDGGYYGDNDIAWLLQSRLGAYLVTDTEDDTTVYRLFHDLLRTTLRERWRELLTPTPPSTTP
ncbi:AAA family ATPase [Dactylosporangium sp. NPDC048998]|uniref:AAA family ATPase n=1 Tax=Dactylosporangium sp. NPDC048998 TaxID=3363976 RepID=UPI0037208172